MRTIQVLLQKLGIAGEVVCVHMGGNTTIQNLENAAAQLAGVKRLCSRVWCLIDSEAIAEGKIEGNRKAFLDLCLSMDIHAHATSLQATENYLTEAACKAVIGEHALGPEHFSKPTKEVNGWTKHQAWQIAAAMDPIEFRDVGEFLLHIAKAVRQHRNKLDA